jgi:fatty-acyl-CoA synthase
VLSSGVSVNAHDQPTAALAQAESSLPSRSPHETLVGALERAADDDAPYLTLHTGREPIEFDARKALEGARRQAALLGERGVERGDRVVLLTPTSPLFFESFYGANLIGAIPVPLASPMTFGGLGRYLQNLSAIIEDSGARVIVTSPRMRDAIAEDDALGQRLAHVLTEEDTAGGGRAVPTPSLDGRDTAFIQYTSGTTGRPKGAVISHRALLANTYAINKGLDLVPEDVVVSWLPLFHDMGLIGTVLTTLCHPLRTHILRPESFLMKPGRWIDLLSDKRGTLAASPNFGYDLCVSRGKTLPDIRLDSWRAALNGAEPVHPATVQRFCNRYAGAGFDPGSVMPVYGMAEATLAITFPRLDRKYETLSVDREVLERDGEAVPGTAHDAYQAVSVGYPLAGTSVRIASSSGGTAVERTVGEVLVNSPCLMDGYYRNQEATAGALVDGWLHTGDLGFMDAGRLFIVGRAKEMIIKGGRNIYPYDVEQIAGEIKGVNPGGVAAFARPNPQTGTDDLVVYAETREKQEQARAGIAKEITGELLAALSIKADEVRMVAAGSLPRTTSGKIRRGECARRAARGEEV